MSLKYEQKNRMRRSRQAKTALFVFLALYGIGGTALGQSAIQSVTDAASLLAMARKERAAGHRIEALTYTQDVLVRWPDNFEARELNIQILSELGAAARAKELAANLPDAAQKMRLTADYDAHEVRWARGEPVNPHRPYDEADKAAADIRKLANDPNAPADIRERARMDLLAVLDQADRAEEVLANYAPMKKRDEQLPAYAEEAVADAMMQEHDARDAIPLYEDSIRRDPGPYDPSQTDPRIGLAYAYLAAGRAHDALKTIDDLNQREPKWRHPRDVKSAKENQRKVDADTNAASIEQDAGYLQDSYNHLAALSAEAPASADIRRQLAMAELARGWPRRAMEALKIADTYDERDAAAALDQAAAHRAMYDYADVQADLAQAQQEAGRSGRVQDAQAAWQRESGWQFDVAHDNGWGNSPDYGDRDQETQASLASPLLDNHWRVVALAQYASASLPEGNVSRERAGIGLQAFFHGMELYAQVLPAIDNFVRRTDFAAGFNWSINDQWTWSTDWSSASNDVPLRAQYYGIAGDSVSTAVQWRASELTSARLAVYRDRFTDGNLREGWLADVVQRLHTGENLTWDGGVEIGGSHNSEVDRPYFNPSEDRSYALTSVFQNTLNQYEDRSWTERVDLTVGEYAERNYSTGLLVSARYGQTYQPRAGLRFGWGVAWHYQPYDGRYESRVVLDLSMHWGE